MKLNVCSHDIFSLKLYDSYRLLPLKNIKIKTGKAKKQFGHS